VNDAEGLVRAVELEIDKLLLPAAIGDRIAGLIRLDEPSPPLTRELWLLAHPGYAACGAYRSWPIGLNRRQKCLPGPDDMR